MTALRTLWGAQRRKRTITQGCFSADHNTTRLDCLIRPHGAPLFSQTALLPPALSSSPSQLLWFKALLCVQLSTSHPPIPLLSSNLSDPGPCDSIYSFLVGGGDWWKHRYSCHVESFQTQRSHPRFSKRVPAAWDMRTAVGQDQAHTHQLDSEEFGHMFSICHGKYIFLQGNNTGGLWRLPTQWVYFLMVGKSDPHWAMTQKPLKLDELGHCA